MGGINLKRTKVTPFIVYPDHRMVFSEGVIKTVRTEKCHRSLCVQRQGD